MGKQNGNNKGGTMPEGSFEISCPECRHFLIDAMNNIRDGDVVERVICSHCKKMFRITLKNGGYYEIERIS